MKQCLMTQCLSRVVETPRPRGAFRRDEGVPTPQSSTRVRPYLMTVVLMFALLVPHRLPAETQEDQKAGLGQSASAEARQDTRKPGAPKEVKEGGKVKEQKSGEWTPNLSDAEKETLFAIAQDTLDWCVKGNKSNFSFDKYQITDKMRANTATFVTLKIDGMLRGCIGSLAPEEPMYKSVHNNTVNAALHDYRFTRVTVDEISTINIHISLLSPIEDIRSLDAFKLGAHGIIMEKGRYRAVYLPEVAIEQKWTKEETLESLSEKAGLPGGAWKEGARFKVFSSVVLSKE